MPPTVPLNPNPDYLKHHRTAAMRMAAISKRLLHFRPYFHSHPGSQPYPLRHFSSSSVPSGNPQSEHVPEPDSAAQSQSSFSSYFNEVKASLQREPPPQNRHQAPRKPLSFSNRTPPQSPPPSRAASLEEIRRNLSEFRLRSTAPPPSSSSSQHISFQELYKKNVTSRADGSAPSPDSSTGKQPVGPGAGGIHSYDTIRESFRRLKATPPAARGPNASGGKPIDPLSLSRFKESLNLKPDTNADLDSTMVIGGSDRLPPSFYGRERSGRWESLYGYPDLGKKLKMLRPENRKGKWFSLQELRDRLAKLREIEDKKSKAELGVSVNDIRDSLLNFSTSKDEKASPATMQRLPILGHLGRTPSFMLSPPKEHLVEKFFHPDNMSSAETLKLELKKVRDEFKMSESDCGSARVQVAQLTTKIMHLSTVLHKKDKHSRRGLQAMVQRRKKLLKYLRRTDWDSYCLVLSKLGLRDNPDIKA